MRYIITQSQLHNLIYKYLDDMFSNMDFRKEGNDPINPSLWRIYLFDKNKKNTLTYFWYEPGVDDDDNPHNGIGNLHIDPIILDTLRTSLGVRETKIIDIVTDWVSQKLNVDIDEIAIHPHRNRTPNY